jgi:type I restriction enzyme, R subunit
MRHLLNTYVQAEPAKTLGELGDLSLTELIVQTGIHDAIARSLNDKGRLSKNAIAEGIINNIRKTIIREQLTEGNLAGQFLRPEGLSDEELDAVRQEEGWILFA